MLRKSLKLTKKSKETGLSKVEFKFEYHRQLLN